MDFSPVWACMRNFEALWRFSTYITLKVFRTSLGMQMSFYATTVWELCHIWMFQVSLALQGKYVDIQWLDLMLAAANCCHCQSGETSRTWHLLSMWVSLQVHHYIVDISDANSCPHASVNWKNIKVITRGGRVSESIRDTVNNLSLYWKLDVIFHLYI